MRGRSSDLGLLRLRNYLLERNPSHQPVRKCVTLPGEVENSPKAHPVVDCEDYKDFEHFVQPET